MRGTMTGKGNTDPILYDDQKTRKRCEEDIESTKRRATGLRRRLEKLPLRQACHRRRYHRLERIRRGFWLSWCQCCNPASLGAGGRTERFSARTNLCGAFRSDASRSGRRRCASTWRDRKRPAGCESKAARCALLRIARRQDSRSHSRVLVALCHLANQPSRL